VSARQLTAFLAVLAFIGLLAYGLISKGEARLAIGEPVPDKTLPWLDGAGSGRIADYRGKWVLVNLWASWCDPCKQESPVLQALSQRERARGLVVLGINVQDNSDDARAFVKRFHLTYPQLLSVGDDRSRAFGTTGLPESFLVNPSGHLALIRRGVVDRRYLARFVTPQIGAGAR
jgi:cytochrome c biogenesis protein CcmG, thiol:disulfide interchange protein DsbE